MMIKDMPKLESPFVRELNEKGEYFVIDKIAEGYEWVFNDERVMALEKLHGTNVSIQIVDGVIVSIWNRTERIPFFNKGKPHIIKGILESYQRGYMEFLPDGQYFGELIGPKVNGNPYKLTEHIWIPFSTYCQEHLRYKSWGKYPKDFKTISEWFKELIPLYASRVQVEAGRENGFVEGVVFTHPDGRMAKLRKDMFDWFKGERHNDFIKLEGDKNKESQSQQAVGYSLSLQMGTNENNRSKLLGIKPIWSNKK